MFRWIPALECVDCDPVLCSYTVQSSIGLRERIERSVMTRSRPREVEGRAVGSQPRSAAARGPDEASKSVQCEARGVFRLNKSGGIEGDRQGVEWRELCPFGRFDYTTTRAVG